MDREGVLLGDVVDATDVPATIFASPVEIASDLFTADQQILSQFQLAFEEAELTGVHFTHVVCLLLSLPSELSCNRTPDVILALGTVELPSATAPTSQSRLSSL